MGIYGNAGVDPKGMGQDHIGCFAGYSWQGEKLLHLLGNFSLKISHDFVAGLLDMLGLISIEPRRVNQCLNLISFSTR